MPERAKHPRRLYPWSSNPATTAEPNPVQSRLISAVIAPALQLWLRSQVERAKQLQVKIEAGDPQILAGRLHRISISGQNVVYQGLHLSQIHLTGTNIGINLGQVLRGQPLRLLEVTPVEAELRVQVADLNASLQAPLLATAGSEFLVSLLQASGWNLAAPGTVSLNLEQVGIDADRLMLTASLVSANDLISLVLYTGLQLTSPHELRLVAPQWFSPDQVRLPSKDLDGFKLDLGPVTIQEFTLGSGQLVCRGQINVVPAQL